MSDSTIIHNTFSYPTFHGSMLETEIIRLVPPSDKHAELVAAWRNDPKVYNGFIEYVPTNAEQQRAFFAGLRNHTSRMVWIIEHRPASAYDPWIPIGSVGLIDIDIRNRHCEFGPIYIGNHDYRGKGLAMEAEQLVIAYAFDHLGMHRVYAHTTVSNEAVVAFHERAGFHRESILKDHILRYGTFEGVHLLAILETDDRPRLGK